MKQIYTLCLCICMSSIAIQLNSQNSGFDFDRQATYFTNVFDEGAAEIVEYDPLTERVFFTNADANTVVVLDISNPYEPRMVAELSQDPYGGGVNSLDVYGNIVAVAVEADVKQDNGAVVFWDTNGNYLNHVEVGPLPDMVIFTNNGSKVLVANEGEPNDDYTVDPEGSISIIDLKAGVANATVETATFSAFTDADALNQQGIRIFGPGATPAQDLEPEFIAVSDDDAYAYVVCQENNAVAVVNINAASVDAILPLGTKDFNDPENMFDPSNRDGGINFVNYPVLSFYMPDAIQFKTINGTGYLFTANEGDARDYDGYSEEERVKDLLLDPTVFPDAATLQQDENLGRLKITTANGDIDGDGDFDEIYGYGGRSFSIWNAMTGELVFDSKDMIERKIAELLPNNFNATNDENDFDGRSDDKGPEPEAIEVIDYNGKVLALVGLERVGGVMVFDVSDVNNVSYVNYYNNRRFSYGEQTNIVGDLGIEDIVFIPASDSPNGKDLVVTSNEVSGTVSIFAVNDLNDILFDEEIEIADYQPLEVIVPPSPLSIEPIFIGGHDIVQTTPTYGNPAGRAVAKEWHDFIGFTPDDTGQSLGWVSVNHEQIYRDDRIGDGGGMTAFRVGKSNDGSLEVLEQTLDDGRQGHFFNVDFVNTVGETGMNCGGIVGPNGRIWTAEEWYRSSMSSIWNGVFRGADRGDSWSPHNPAPMAGGYGVRDTSSFTIIAPEFPMVDGMTIDKYDNFNYMTEIDPKQAVAIRKQYNWGRAGWEGGAISLDGKYVYLGIDGSPAPWVRFTADTPFDFTQGTIAVYKHDNAQDERWIDVPMNIENTFGGLTAYAWEVGATMFVRNEWVTLDPATGIIYWTETGRDSGSSGPGILFNALTSETNAVVAPHHDALAKERGFEDALDPAYQDYYGRVLYYDPSNHEVGVTIHGGPYFENSPSEADYPDKHLSNPDGLSILTIDGQNFLMIQEDLNGSSFGRSPDGISNRLCELYLLDTRKKEATVDDLVRVTGIPRGAEITGAIQIDENIVLVNSQHPNADNPFPWNHSTTIAIYGFADVELSELQGTEETFKSAESISVNKTTRELKLKKTGDYAMYDKDGKRIKVYRDKNVINLETVEEGEYYLIDDADNMYKLKIN